MNQPDNRLLIVLEAREEKFAEKLAPSSQGLVAVLRGQIQNDDEAKSLTQRFDRWKATLEPQKRKATLAIVSVLLISSLAFGLGFALQIDQVERPGFSFSERIGSLFLVRGAAAQAAVQDTASTSANTFASYGAGFGWADRFSSVEIMRETASSKVLWPVSTIISILILTILMLPRSNRMPQKLSTD